MNLIDLIRRQTEPVPWAEGDNIPWNEPDFSERMLREHLSQAHDLASRRLPTIDHLADLADLVMPGRFGLRILDLGCGTGLAGVVFKSRAARLDGIDLSPAMIERARARHPHLEFVCGDAHDFDPGETFDYVICSDLLNDVWDVQRVLENLGRA